MLAIVMIQNVLVLNVELEKVREKLNKSFVMGCHQEQCYHLSLEMDRLLEQYLERKGKR